MAKKRDGSPDPVYRLGNWNVTIPLLLKTANQTVQFKRATLTVGSMANRIRADVNLGSTRDCWLQPIDADLARVYEARDIRVTHRLYYVVPQALQEGDLAEVTTDTERAGETVVTYVVREYKDASAGLRKLYAADVEERLGGS